MGTHLIYTQLNPRVNTVEKLFPPPDAIHIIHSRKTITWL